MRLENKLVTALNIVILIFVSQIKIIMGILILISLIVRLVSNTFVNFGVLNCLSASNNVSVGTITVCQIR